MKLHYKLLTSALFSMSLVAPSYSQTNFPQNPVTIIVPYGPGGGADIFARTIAPKMGEKLGQPIVVENKAGGGTAIAASDVTRARPDGYRILLGDVSTFATNTHLYQRLSYDPRDLAPITLAGRSPYLLLVNPKVHPQTSLKEFVSSIQKAPTGTVNYGSAGNGGPSHLAAEMFVRSAGVNLIHVPYKGSGPALPDLLAGNIGMMFMDYAPAKAQISGGKLRALAVTSTQPTPILPGIPTLASVYPGFEAWFWIALAAPKGTPIPIIDKIREAYIYAVNDPETRKTLVEVGIEPLQSTSLEMDTYVKSESVRLGRVIKEAGIQLD
ncbi:MAG: tripartite tricarboxylate transporter substrate binding protein [Betaproteobacteria bacterium]